MKNYLITGIVIVAVVLLGVLVFGASGSEYVQTVDEQVTELEQQLAEVAVLVESGELDEEAATQARADISARLNAITEAVNSPESESLSSADKKALVAALERFKSALTEYRDTLVAVEETAMVETQDSSDEDTDTDSSKEVSRRPMYPGTITAHYEEVVEVLEDNIDEVVPDDELEELTDPETFAEITDDNASSSEAETATTSEEAADATTASTSAEETATSTTE